MSDSFVNAVAGSGAPIDAEQVTTGAGAVYRQIVGLGDPATGGNRAAINSSGGLAIARYNGATWDPSYNANNPVTLLAPAARTVLTSSPVITNYNWPGFMVLLNITAGASPSLQIYVAVGGAGVLLAPFTTAVTATGAYAYIYAPGCTSTPYGVTPGVIQQFATALPGAGFSLTVAPGNANSIAYSLTLYPITFS